MVPLLWLLALACAGCESFEDREPENKAGAPPCDDCYVVNAAISGWGDRIFVGGYFGENQTGLVRELRDGSWGQVADPSMLRDVRQLWASEHALFFTATDGVRQVDLDSGEVEKIVSREFTNTVVWGSGPDDVVVVDSESAQRFDGESWTESAFSLGGPDAIGGQSSSDLFVLDVTGQIAHSDGGDFAPLGAQAPLKPNDIWDAGGFLLAVAGDDHGGGSTGPGAIMRFDADQWDILQEAPRDALLGVAASSDGELVFAVGATNDHTQVHGVVWRFAKKKWTRHVLPNVNAFLWDVWCSDDDACYAVGTDNTFIDLSELD